MHPKRALDAAAAPRLDNVIALIIWIDLLKFHRLVTDNTIHQWPVGIVLRGIDFRT
jgi:hypothetical protein